MILFICPYEVSLIVPLPPQGCVSIFQTRPLFESRPLFEFVFHRSSSLTVHFGLTKNSILGLGGTSTSSARKRVNSLALLLVPIHLITMAYRLTTLSKTMWRLVAVVAGVSVDLIAIFRLKVSRCPAGTFSSSSLESRMT